MGGEYNSPARLLSLAAMRILALDTSTPAGSVALAEDGVLVACRSGDPQRTHGERLPGDVTALLAARSLTFAAIDRYAVCSGPGSFTGLRVGLATIQALALVHRRPVAAVPTLAAVACAAAWAGDGDGDERADWIGVWMNAHRGEVFAALYAAPPAGAAAGDRLPPEEVAGPLAAAPEVVLRRWRGLLGGDRRRVAVIGDAVASARELLEAELDCCGLLTPQAPPLAPIAARIAVAADAGAPHAVRPVYVRRPDAELARERRLAAARARLKPR